MKTHIIHSEEDMINLGKELAKDAKIILLEGDLGAGKTTFTKGFAQGLGIDARQVQSPTYTYLNIYENKLLHIDMYRISTLQEIREKGILAEIYDHERIIIEWPKFEQELSLPNHLHIHIQKTAPTERKVSIIQK